MTTSSNAATVDVFDSKGRIILDVPREALDAMTADRRKRHARLVDSARTAEKAEADLTAANDAVRAAARAHVVALETLDRVRPKQTFHSLWKETFKASA